MLVCDPFLGDEWAVLQRSVIEQKPETSNWVVMEKVKAKKKRVDFDLQKLEGDERAAMAMLPRCRCKAALM